MAEAKAKAAATMVWARTSFEKPWRRFSLISDLASWPKFKRVACVLRRGIVSFVSCSISVALKNRFFRRRAGNALIIKDNIFTEFCNTDHGKTSICSMS